MGNLAQTKVGQIVAQNFRTARVLTDHGIDFCCRGGISLQEACQRHDVSLEALTTELEVAGQWPDDHDYSSMSLTELIHEIVDVHHQYVRTTAPALKTYLEKLVKVHGERHAELHRIEQQFSEAAEALTAHLKKEELILFPYTCPPDGCQTYRVAYALLQEFEADLHEHIHLENNLLFPQAQQRFANFSFK